jgi:hypothetical protein
LLIALTYGGSIDFWFDTLFRSHIRGLGFEILKEQYDLLFMRRDFLLERGSVFTDHEKQTMFQGDMHPMAWEKISDTTPDFFRA